MQHETPRASTQKTVSILLVEDGTEIMSLARSYLERRGDFRVDPVVSIRQALDRIKSKPYDIILAFDQLPDVGGIEFVSDMSGLELLKYLKQTGNTTPFILYSHHSRDKITVEDLSYAQELTFPRGEDIRPQLDEISLVLRQAVLRKRLERDMRNQYESLLEMVSSSPVAVCRVSGTIIEWASDQLPLLFREPPGSFKGRDISAIFPDQSISDRALREMTLHKDPDGFGRTEARCKRSDGTEIFCRLSLRQVDPDDASRGVLLSVTDITEVVELREEVRQLEVRYRELQQISGTLIMRTGDQGKILFMNKAGLELFGYSDREILGKTVAEAIMAPGSEGAPVGDPFATPITGEESGMHISEHVRRNGDRVFIAWTFRPVSGQEGEGTETLWFGHDITDYEHPGFGRISTASWRDPIIAGTDVEGEVFDAVFHICTEIVREGREGHKVGTTFIVGDAPAVMEQSRQLGLNPFEGHPEGRRTVTNPDTKENIKEFATMDGAFVVNGYGVFEAARRYLTAPAEGIDIPEGFGTRHRSAAAMTKVTRSIAFVVSESGGRISILRDGRIVKLIA